jgi:hypothetical protein
VPFLATGGGSGYTFSTGALKEAIGIDLGFFRDVQVDANDNRLTVGGGVIFDDIYEPVHAAGKEIQTGSCSCVGMVGAALGGGIGPYQGVHGLLLDALKSVTIVTGSGEIVTASEHENADLFWGIRGAGQNFGIVTSATFQLHDQTNGGLALNGDFVYPASSGKAVFELISHWAKYQPNELSLFGNIMFDRLTQQTVLMISAIYIGPEEEGMKYMRQLRDETPLRESVGALPWNRLIKENRFGVDALACMKGGNHSVLGMNLHKFDAATYVNLVDKFDKLYAQNPNLVASILVFELFPNAVTRSVPDKATAYPYRDAIGYLFLSFLLPDAASAALAEEFGLETRNELVATGSRDGTLEVYVNYAHGNEGEVAWYSARKLCRLRALKARWDPKQLFSWTNAVTLNED